MPLPILPLILGGLGAVFVTTIGGLLRDWVAEPEPAEPDVSATAPPALGTVSRTERTERRAGELDGYTIYTGHDRDYRTVTDAETNTPVPELMAARPFVALVARPTDPPYRLTGIDPERDLGRAIQRLTRDPLRLLDDRLELPCDSTERWAAVGRRLVIVARALSDGPAWLDWLADDRPEDRDTRHALLLEALPRRPQARAVAARRIGDPDPVLRAHAALVLDTVPALDRALDALDVPAALHRALFEARFQHGVEGFQRRVAAGLTSDDVALAALAARCTRALPLPAAHALLRVALGSPHPRAQRAALSELALRDAEAAGGHAVQLFGATDLGLRGDAVAAAAGGLAPARLTALAVPLLSADPAAAEAACDALAKAGTLDAVMPLRRLADRADEMLAFTARCAVEEIQARAAGAVGGLALSDAEGGELALSDG